MDIASDVLRAIETHSGLAAWVQAIGAIISLWAAIIIPRQSQRHDALVKAKTLQLALREFVDLSAEASKKEYFAAPAAAHELRNKLDALLIPAAITASSIIPSALKTRRQLNVVVDVSNWAIASRWSLNGVLGVPTSGEHGLTLKDQLIAVEKAVRDAHHSAVILLARMKKEFRF